MISWLFLVWVGLASASIPPCASEAAEPVASGEIQSRVRNTRRYSAVNRSYNAVFRRVIRQAREGDSVAREDLGHILYEAIRPLAVETIPSRLSAEREDAIQETVSELHAVALKGGEVGQFVLGLERRARARLAVIAGRFARDRRDSVLEVDLEEGDAARNRLEAEDNTVGIWENPDRALDYTVRPERRAELERLITSLRPRLQLCMRLRYGFNLGNREHTVAETADIMKVTDKRVHQLEAQGIVILQRKTKNSALSDLFVPVKQLRDEERDSRGPYTVLDDFYQALAKGDVDTAVAMNLHGDFRWTEPSAQFENRAALVSHLRYVNKMPGTRNFTFPENREQSSTPFGEIQVTRKVFMPFPNGQFQKVIYLDRWWWDSVIHRLTRYEGTFETTEGYFSSSTMVQWLYEGGGDHFRFGMQNFVHPQIRVFLPDSAMSAQFSAPIGFAQIFSEQGLLSGKVMTIGSDEMDSLTARVIREERFERGRRTYRERYVDTWERGGLDQPFSVLTIKRVLKAEPVSP